MYLSDRYWNGIHIGLFSLLVFIGLYSLLVFIWYFLISELLEFTAGIYTYTLWSLRLLHLYYSLNSEVAGYIYIYTHYGLICILSKVAGQVLVLCTLWISMYTPWPLLSDLWYVCVYPLTHWSLLSSGGYLYTVWSLRLLDFILLVYYIYS